jgi:hypothetical protein
MGGRKNKVGLGFVGLHSALSHSPQSALSSAFAPALLFFVLSFFPTLLPLPPTRLVSPRPRVDVFPITGSLPQDSDFVKNAI